MKTVWIEIDIDSANQAVKNLKKLMKDCIDTSNYDELQELKWIVQRAEETIENRLNEKEDEE